MGSRHADRLWLAGGAAVVALLVAITWLLLVSGQRTATAGFQEQTDTAHTQAAQLRTRTAKLAADHARIRELTADRDALAAALPDGSGVPEFLRQLQGTGTAVGVDVSGITVGSPVAVETVPGVWALPIQLTAEGNAAKLGAFLDQLQGASQKRAVLIETANLDSEGDDAAGAAREMSLDLVVKAFVAPPLGAGAPVVNAD
jgi:type IV pilus assembly protein PilO